FRYPLRTGRPRVNELGRGGELVEDALVFACNVSPLTASRFAGARLQERPGIFGIRTSVGCKRSRVAQLHRAPVLQREGRSSSFVRTAMCMIECTDVDR